MSYCEVMSKSAAFLFMCAAAAFGGQLSQTNPSVIKLAIPAPRDSAGGIIVADVNNDRKMDYIVTVPGHLAVYDNSGKKLWINFQLKGL